VYSLASVGKEIKARNMRWAEYVARIEKWNNITRGEAFVFTMSAMLAQLTLWKTKNKKSYVFRGSVVLHTLEHSRINQLKCIVATSSQPGARYERKPQIGGWQRLAGWSWLTMHFIWSVLLCSSVWNTTEARSKTEDFFLVLFFKVLAGLTRLTWLTWTLRPWILHFCCKI
jgi:hypothetical protein